MYDYIMAGQRRRAAGYIENTFCFDTVLCLSTAALSSKGASQTSIIYIYIYII